MVGAVGSSEQGTFDRVVCDEEEGGRGRGAERHGADAAVDVFEAARGEEAGGGLEARFERVERVERDVSEGAGYGAGLRGVSEIWKAGRVESLRGESGSRGRRIHEETLGF